MKHVECQLLKVFVPAFLNRCVGVPKKPPNPIRFDVIRFMFRHFRATRDGGGEDSRGELFIVNGAASVSVRDDAEDPIASNPTDPPQRFEAVKDGASATLI